MRDECVFHRKSSEKRSEKRDKGSDTKTRDKVPRISPERDETQQNRRNRAKDSDPDTEMSDPGVHRGVPRFMKATRNIGYRTDPFGARTLAG